MILFTYHLKFPGRVHGDVIMAKIIGRAIAWLRKQSGPLPPGLARRKMLGSNKKSLHY